MQHFEPDALATVLYVVFDPALDQVRIAMAGHFPGAFVVDLTRTQFCDTSGLHALVGAHKRARAGGDMLLVAPGAGVLRIFAITGLDQVFPSYASLEEALAQIH